MATSNVIALPTAAKQKVRQCRSRTKAADRKALIQFPTDKVRKSYSESVLIDARAMLETDAATATQIALAVFSVLPDRDRLKVMGRLAGLALRNHRGTSAALAWINYEMSSTTRRAEIFAAAEWLQQEGGL